MQLPELLVAVSVFAMGASASLQPAATAGSLAAAAQGDNGAMQGQRPWSGKRRGDPAPAIAAAAAAGGQQQRQQPDGQLGRERGSEATAPAPVHAGRAGAVSS